MTLFLQLLAVAGLLLLNAFFVAAEYALVTARRTRLEPRPRPAAAARAPRST